MQPQRSNFSEIQNSGYKIYILSEFAVGKLLTICNIRCKIRAQNRY